MTDINVARRFAPAGESAFDRPVSTKPLTLPYAAVRIQESRNRASDLAQRIGALADTLTGERPGVGQKPGQTGGPYSGGLCQALIAEVDNLDDELRYIAEAVCALEGRVNS